MIADLPAREGVDIAVLEAAYHEVAERLADGISDDEMERARSLITSNWLHHLATVDGRADTFSQFTTLFDAPELVNDMLPRLLAVTAEEAARWAGEVIRPDNRLVLQFVPADEAAA
jgi:predicted Zn-dependent peptidase